MTIFWKIIFTILLLMIITTMVGFIGSLMDDNKPRGMKICKVALYTLVGEAGTLVMAIMLHLWSIL